MNVNEYFLENTFARFFDLIQYVALFSVPVIIVWLVMNNRKKQLQMKYDIIMKSLDNGVQVDPKELLTPEKSPFTVAEKKLRRGIIEGGIGLFLAALGLFVFFNLDLSRIQFMSDKERGDAAMFIVLVLSIAIIGIVLLSIGISNIAGYLAYKKQLRIKENNGTDNQE